MRNFADAVNAWNGCVAAGFVSGMVAITLVTATLPAVAQEDADSAVQFAPDDEPAPAPAAASAAAPVDTSTTGDEDEAPETAPGDAKSKEVGPTAVAAPEEPRAEATPKDLHGAGNDDDPEANKSDDDHKIYHRGDSHNDTLFGSYRVRLMYGKPNFNNGLKYYNFLYGQPKGYPEIAIDWFAWDWYATLGLSFRFGYYTADGHAAQDPSAGGASISTSSVNQSQLAKDPNGPTTLTLIPIQLLFTMETTPFPKKWVVFDGWFGIERLYYQETRNQLATASSTSTTATGTSSTGTSTTGTSTTSTTTTPTTSAIAPKMPRFGDITTTADSTLTNTGWRNSIVVGAAANLLLNGLDEQSTASLRPLGISAVYLSPYMEWIRTIGLPAGNTVSFGRTVIGIAFTFESIR